MTDVFCRIADRDDGTNRVLLWRDDLCAAFLSNRPMHPGHALVIPRAPIDHWTDVPGPVLAHMHEVARAVSGAQRKAFPSRRTALVLAGFEVPHCHLHVIPADELGDIDLRSAEVVDEDSLVLPALRLRAYMDVPDEQQGIIHSTVDHRVRPGQSLSVALLGSPGSGKSTFARALCDRLGPRTVRVNGDATKARLWGSLDNAQRNDDGKAEERHAEAFAEVHRQAEAAVRGGHHLVRDYRHSGTDEQDRAAALGARYGAYTVFVWILVAPETAVSRSVLRVRQEPGRTDYPGWSYGKALEVVRDADRTARFPTAGGCVVLDGRRPAGELLDAFLEIIGWGQDADQAAGSDRSPDS